MGRFQQHRRALLRVSVIVNASAHVVNHRRQAQQPSLLPPQTMKRPRQVEQLGGDFGHASLVIDRAEFAKNPPLKRLMLQA